VDWWFKTLARISHHVSAAALRSLGLLDVLSSTPAGPSVARHVSTPVRAARPLL
jgi:hypothetical protein